MPDVSEASAFGSASSSNWAFLVDENLPRFLAPLLRSAGYHAEDVRDVGLMTHPDTEVWSYAQTQACAIVTQDADFADIRAYPPPHAGIVIVDIPDRLTIALKMQIVLDGLAQIVGQSLADAIVTISPGHVRIRR